MVVFGAGALVVQGTQARSSALGRFDKVSEMQRFMLGMAALVLAPGCGDQGTSELPMDPFSVRLTVVSDDGYDLDEELVPGGIYTPVLEGEWTCDDSTVLELGPWFRLNLATGRSILWSSTDPALVVLPWPSGGFIRAETSVVHDASLDEDGVSITLQAPEYCSGTASESSFARRESGDNCDPLEDIVLHVDRAGAWSSPEVCVTASERGENESCYVSSDSSRVPCL